MQKQEKIDDLGFCPSFNCYSSDSLASTAATKVSCELQQEQAAQVREFSLVDEDDFEFSLVLGDEEVSVKDIASEGRIVFPLFNRDLLVKDELCREAQAKDNDNEDEDEAESLAMSIPLRKLFINDRGESSSSSSSEADEFETVPSGTFCVWRPKLEVESSPLTKCKKSSSTGSGSKRWRICDLLRRSNSDGKEPMLFLTPKTVEVPKQKRNSGEASKVAGKLKEASSSQSIHELFYV